MIRNPIQAAMVKRELLDMSKSFMEKMDGFHYVLTATNFIGLLKMEERMGVQIIKPHGSAGIKNTSSWKRGLIQKIGMYQELNKGVVYVVLMKEPDNQGNLEAFLFDAFLFNNITPLESQSLRHITKEETHGLFMTYERIEQLYGGVEASPFYARLVPIPEQHSPIHGMWILRKYY